MLKRPGQKDRHGFTLTELAIVLGIIGTVLTAIWVASGRVMNSNKVQKATTELVTIVGGYRSLYGAHGIDTPSGGFTDVTCVGIGGGYFPSDMIKTGTTCSGSPATPNFYPQTPLGNGGTVIVYADPDVNTIWVNFNGLTQAICNGLASAVFSSDNTYQYIYNGSGWAIANYLPGGTASASSSAIAAACTGTSSNNQIQVGFTAQ